MKTKNTSAPNNLFMKQHFDAVMDHLAFGISMHNVGSKMGNHTLPFVKSTLEISAKNPKLIPGYTELPEFMKCSQTEKDFKLFASEANETLGMLAQSQSSVGKVAYAYALAFYQNVENAANKNVEGAKPVYKKLKKEFDKYVSAPDTLSLAA